MRLLATKLGWSLSDKGLMPATKSTVCVRTVCLGLYCCGARAWYTRLLTASFVHSFLTQEGGSWKGRSIVCYTEAEIFAALGLPYKVGCGSLVGGGGGGGGGLTFLTITGLTLAWGLLGVAPTTGSQRAQLQRNLILIHNGGWQHLAVRVSACAALFHVVGI